MDNLVGQDIKGYTLRESIGAGGFGAVFRAYQSAIEREVAIKIILPEYANQPDFIRRFEAEAHLVARLEHIHIVPLYDYWRDPNGAYLVMRWLRGGSLRDLLKRGKLDLETTTQILDQVASALTVAHRHNVVHRDMKPDNILLDEAGNAYLADFGIALDTMSASQPDESDTLTGSPAYMSPEQISGSGVTAQTDLYSLGIILYEMLTGQHPFPDTTITGLLFKQLREPVPSLHWQRPDLPEDLDVVIQRATAKEASARYAEAIDLAREFRRIIYASSSLSYEADSTPAQGIQILTGREATLMDFAAPEPENPYKGLHAFQEADAVDFFGRETLTQQLLLRLSELPLEARFLAVIGPSGSGKSSVVKAGVIPALRRGALPSSDQWFIVEMVPGMEPFQELESALLSVAVNQHDRLIDQLRASAHGLKDAIQRILPADEGVMFLFIDQFEEIFTLVEDESERARFLDNLMVALREVGQRLRVVVSLRADFYDRPLLYPEFGTLVRQRTEVVLPLSKQELQDAIVRPAERVGLAMDMGLVEAILKDVSEQPGALPLLQYALTELFERREKHTLTLQAYIDSGGVLGALARRADETFTKLYSDEQKAARQLFLRLVTLGEGTEDTRRRVLQSELASIGDDKEVMRGVIDQFGQYRLLTFDRDPITRSPTVEVAHEALIRQWSRLRQWLEGSREDVRLQRRLASDAAEWLKARKETSFLASGARLQQFEEWAVQTDLGLNQLEQDYLKASLARRIELEAQEKARQEREDALERRSRERLRALVIVLAIATVGALILTVFAFNQRQQAETNADIAESNADRAQNLLLAANAQLVLGNNNTELALALALQTDWAQVLLGQRALYDAAYAPGIRYRFEQSAPVLSAAFSPDETLALSGSTDHTVSLWDLKTNTLVRQFDQGHTDAVRSVAFSPDGKTALSGSADKSVILWEVATGKVLRHLNGHTDAVWSVAFSPDGKTALSAGANDQIILWDIASGTSLRRFTPDTPPSMSAVYSVVFTPDGHQALAGLDDGSVILWDVDQGAIIRRFGADGDGHTPLASVWSVAVSPDGKTALSGSSDRTVIVWDMTTGKTLRHLKGHNDWVLSVAFSPDGRLAVSGSEDNKVVLWNLGEDTGLGARVGVFEGHNGKVQTVAFSPDGRQVLSGSTDNSLIVWDIRNGAELNRFAEHTDWVNSVAFSPDGKIGASASVDGTVILWDLTTGKLLRQLTEPGKALDERVVVWAVTFSPDGKTVLGALDDTRILQWEVASGQIVREFNGHLSYVDGLAFSPDGRTFLSASGDNTLILWDAASGAIIRTYGSNGEGHTDAVTGVVFTRDGRQALSGSYDGTILLWDVETAQVLRKFTGHTDQVNGIALSPDGRTFLSASSDTTVIVWDMETGEKLHLLREHSSAVYGAVFSPNGQNILSASADNSLILWNVAAGRSIARLVGHGDQVTSVAFSPDGHAALSGSYDNTVMYWRSDSVDELVRWIGANRYVRPLNCVERDQYDIQPACDAQGNLPAPLPSVTNTVTPPPTVAPTTDLIRTTATPPATTTPTLTPLPTATPTLIPPSASLGSQTGEVVKGDRDAWAYSGRTGEVLTISANADQPVNSLGPDEGTRRGFLDTNLLVYAPDGTLVGSNDDIADGLTNSKIIGLVLPTDGVYVIEVRSYGNQMAGKYRLTIEVGGTVTP